MGVRIVINCDDFYVAQSLFNLSGEIENTDILEPVYNENKTATYDDEHCTAHIEYVKDTE